MFSAFVFYLSLLEEVFGLVTKKKGSFLGVEIKRQEVEDPEVIIMNLFRNFQRVKDD